MRRDQFFQQWLLIWLVTLPLMACLFGIHVAFVSYQWWPMAGFGIWKLASLLFSTLNLLNCYSLLHKLIYEHRRRNKSDLYDFSYTSN